MPRLCIKEFRASWAAFKKNDYRRAINLYESIIAETGDGRTNTLSCLALCYNKLNDVENAIRCGERVLNLDENHVHALQVLAEVYAKKQEYEKAYEYIQRALSNQPGTCMPNPPGCLFALGSLSLSKRKAEIKIAKLESMWYEPLDIEWREWANDFKATYEANQDKISKSTQ